MDPSALLRVQVGVGQEVRHDLANARRIRECQRQVGCDVDAELLVLVGDPRPHQLDDLLDGLADVDRTAVDLDVIGLDARHVEQVVDEVDEAVGRLEDDLDELALSLGHALRRALQQLDESLDRRQRAAQLVGGRRDELALGALEPGALAHVADGPHHAVGLGAQWRRVHGKDSVVVFDDGLPAQRLLDRRKRAVVAVDLVAYSELGNELASPRIDRGDRRRSGFGDDQRVAEAGDRHCESSPLSVELLVGGHQLVGHRVERPCELLQLAGPRRLDAGTKTTGHQAPRRLHEVIERRLHSSHQPRNQRQRAEDREHPGDRHEQERPSRRRAGIRTGLRLAGQLSRLELVGERTRLGKGAGRRRREREAALCGELPGLRLGGDLGLCEPHANGVLLRERHDVPGGGRERGGRLATGSGCARPSGVAQHLLLGHSGAGEVRGRGRQRCAVDELVLVVLTRCVQARHADGRDHRQSRGEAD